MREFLASDLTLILSILIAIIAYVLFAYRAFGKMWFGMGEDRRMLSTMENVFSNVILCFVFAAPASLIALLSLIVHVIDWTK